jgi:uracil-DNA glycosylase
VRDVVIEPTFESWREAARDLLAQKVPPEEIVWREAAVAGKDSAPGLFDEASARAAVPSAALRVPRAFMDLARAAAAHPDPDRWRLLYSVLSEISSGARQLTDMIGNADLARLYALAADVREGRVPPAPPVGASSLVPQTQDLSELARAAAGCRGCDLYRHASRTVFGQGPSSARAVFVGEQPGDQEDLQGAPFVGPAGEVLDRALSEAGISRTDAYVTNVVKHFKFVQRGKRRIHQTPTSSEIGACRPWLEAELAVIRPQVLVCLGATASRTLIGPDFRITRDRGKFLKTGWAPRLMATYHPSAVLRAEDQAGQKRIYDLLTSDLKLVAAELR